MLAFVFEVGRGATGGTVALAHGLRGEERCLGRVLPAR
jgi:hypothetical protein